MGPTSDVKPRQRRGPALDDAVRKRAATATTPVTRASP